MGPVIRLLINLKSALVDCIAPQVSYNDQAAAGTLPVAKVAQQTYQEERHATVELLLQRFGRLINCIPFILIVCVANTNIVAAIWSAFAVSVFINFLDYYRTRYQPLAFFPMVLNFSSLLGYVAIVIIYYTAPHFNLRKYVAPIVVSISVIGVLVSILANYPMTLQTTSQRVPPVVRTSREFLVFNHLLTLYVLFWLAVLMACVWCSTLFEVHTAGQRALGIAVPVVVVLIIALTLPFVAPCLKSQQLLALEQQAAPQGGKDLEAQQPSVPVAVEVVTQQ